MPMNSVGRQNDVKGFFGSKPRPLVFFSWGYVSVWDKVHHWFVLASVGKEHFHSVLSELCHG